MDCVFLFPGQGSQYKNMGKILYNYSDYAKNIFTLSEEILGYDIKDICFNDSNDLINKTQYTQPAIFIYNMIVNNFIEKLGFNPIACAGHSLGEYSALVCAEVLNFEDALLIIKNRALKMEEIGDKSRGSMAAILRPNYKDIEELLVIHKNIVIANYNSPKQIIISGENKLLNMFIEDANKKGMKKIIPLNVSGAFHSPLMKKARIYLEKFIKSVEFNDAKIPIYQNTSPNKNIKSKKIQNNIIKQLDQPVQWEKIINSMTNDGYTHFLEVGPKNVLTNLNKQINPSLRTFASESLKQFQAINV